jgi:GxxExxY protein
MDRPTLSAARLNQLTELIIAAAVLVHRALGPGLLEAAYIACLCHELAEAKLQVETQVAIPLVYKSVHLACAYRADIVVEESVIVEVKAQETLGSIHARQLLTYLRLYDRRVGLILNFGARSMREGIRRVVNEFPQ